ncbi:SdpA family antimicrobial peptide system protein [Pedobacter cryoconitis]|uniref:SdpA family antimicrobial peptide system protein n=1 Tax=Pedobacter cryoconitis TaxID=188932 RepID=UPI000DB97791|nr:SdpA family antimicrobial peptide system protein [Pedobacter cryoconitis]
MHKYFYSYQKSFFLILLTFFWVCTFITVLSVSLPYNPINKTFLKKSHLIKMLLPEGWGFFTRNPRETRTFFLVNDSGKLIQDSRIRNGTIKNVFGLKRDGRLVNLIYMNLLAKRKITWYKYSDSLSVVNYRSKRFRSNQIFIDSVPGIKLNGQIIVVRKTLIPWAFRDYEGKIGQEIKFTKIDVEYKSTVAKKHNIH